jgi:hypothetical protein
MRDGQKDAMSRKVENGRVGMGNELEHLRVCVTASAFHSASWSRAISLAVV